MKTWQELLREIVELSNRRFRTKTPQGLYIPENMTYHLPVEEHPIDEKIIRMFLAEVDGMEKNPPTETQIDQ